MPAKKKPAKPATPDPGFAEIRALAASLHGLQRQMVAVYAPIVQGIIQSRSQNVQEIEPLRMPALFLGFTSYVVGSGEKTRFLVSTRHGSRITIIRHG